MAFSSLEEICRNCEEEKLSFATAVLACHCRENACTHAAAITAMRGRWKAMLAADAAYNPDSRSASGLSGGDGALFSDYAASGRAFCGALPSQMLAAALRMAESNACMRRIVAAPTAGSCGVLPAVLIPLYTDRQFSEEQIVESLFVAAGICNSRRKNALFP